MPLLASHPTSTRKIADGANPDRPALPAATQLLRPDARRPRRAAARGGCPLLPRRPDLRVGLRQAPASSRTDDQSLARPAPPTLGALRLLPASHLLDACQLRRTDAQVRDRSRRWRARRVRFDAHTAAHHVLSFEPS